LNLALYLLAKIPPHAGVHFVAGVAELNLHRLPQALRHLQHAVGLNPARADYGAQLAKALAAGRLMRQALAAADAASKQGPADPVTLDTLGVVYTQGNQHAKAKDLFEQAVGLAPERASYRFNLATSLTFAGRLEEAELAYEACIARDPRYWKAHLALAKLRRVDERNTHLARLEGLLSEWAGRDSQAEMYLNLAISKELEDLGDYPGAFSRMTAGKHAGRKGRDYEAERDRQLFDTLMEAFPAEFENAETGSPNSEPIFVIGMPRTGTTLVDRILSSHPQVHSAGELQNFGVVLKRASGSMTAGLIDADTIRRAQALPWRQVGDAYIDSPRPSTGTLPRFVDKLPHNFLYAGFIARALPNARIVCLRRNPMDSCLGNFRQLFAQHTPYYDYSFDLLDTGRYYLLFDRLMRHWAAVLPGRILEIDYEAIIDEQEECTRRLLAHCGLDWDEGCLRFDENPSPVATASAAQVREPLHRDALQRWKRYEPQLIELKALLERGGIRV
jgi:tetratricopeptide (TPR) repeat protein